MLPLAHTWRPIFNVVQRWKIFWISSVGLYAGCIFAYQSKYSPPADGRARVVWQTNDLKMVRSGSPLPDGCAVTNLPGSAEAATYVPSCRHSRCDMAGNWIPVYIYTSDFITPQDWMTGAKTHWRFRFSPKFAAPEYTSDGEFWRPDERLPPKGKPFAMNYLAPIWSWGPGVLTAIVALFIPPIGLGFTNPFFTDPQGGAAGELNRMNRFNDLARTPGSPCASEDALEVP